MIPVIIHCSDSSFGNAAVITSWHLKRGFETIGYHYVILNGHLSPIKYHGLYDGHLETGRPLDDDDDIQPDEKAAAVLGHNSSVNICMIGTSGQFSYKQLNMLASLVRSLRKQFGEIIVKQHSDYDPVNKPHCAGLQKSIIEHLNNS